MLDHCSGFKCCYDILTDLEYGDVLTNLVWFEIQ